MEDNPHKPIIGLYLKSSTKKNWFVLNELFNLSVDGEEMKLVDDNPDKIVKIDTHPIKTTDFNLNEDKKNFLVLAGRVGALEFITKYHTDIEIDKTNLTKLKNELEELRKIIIVS